MEIMPVAHAIRWIKIICAFLIVGAFTGIYAANADKAQQIKIYKPVFLCAQKLPDEIRADCPANLRDLAIKNATLEAQLSQIAADELAAKARASTRAEQSTQQIERDKNAITNAPRDGAGNIICDAKCLRARSGK